MVLLVAMYRRSSPSVAMASAISAGPRTRLTTASRPSIGRRAAGAVGTGARDTVVMAGESIQACRSHRCASAAGPGIAPGGPRAGVSRRDQEFEGGQPRLYPPVERFAVHSRLLPASGGPVPPLRRRCQPGAGEESVVLR